MTAKRALVTGGIGGIGSAICEELAQKGCHVIAAHHPAEAEAAKARLSAWQGMALPAGAGFSLCAVDVTSFDSCREMAAQTGPIDILVNCAGITRDKTLRKMQPEEWHAVIDVDLSSLFNVTKQYIDAMTDSGFGRIVNISSVNGKKGQFGQTNYSAAKAGVHGFTMALAQEVARKGVTVNSVSPGYVETAMPKAIPAEISAAIVAQIPLGRMAQPAEIAHAVAFLADARTGYITGVNLSINGGLFTSF